MKELKAELMINGPKGQTFATIQIEADGTIRPYAGEAALAQALNLYNELPFPEVFKVVNERA